MQQRLVSYASCDWALCAKAQSELLKQKYSVEG